MRRDYFTLETAGVTAEESEEPSVSITYEGPTDELETRLRRDDGQLDGDGVDVAYRLHEPLDTDAPAGVFAVSDRITGEYVLEVNATSAPVLSVVEAASADADGRYRLVIETDGGTRLAEYDKSTLLVYDGDGNLLRDRSLIPSGVEI
ncbi:uncharacterized protein Nmlp_1346 [Natronomonas moolapensis 8.8.11]|uniref:Uncharacterized protein n=1 Tax=Natronomonas moolapensis (strain DSM 18674 / CECT 7526 / JCM 14361 / 8.8.11) TaxID=268739 RepID=M1XKA7_NATM8|nr:DUF5793 family protein [Natronomonas moolapensis]CCQ35554.1 uncharacterized protein Nmlp_1346 [Natronomonas moolapensis 8.8.11]